MDKVYAIEGPRWHIPYPIEIVEKVNLEQVRTIEVGYRSSSTTGTSTSELRESLMLTGDKNIIDLQFAVQYNLKSVEDFLFENRSAESAVRGAAAPLTALSADLFSNKKSSTDLRLYCTAN